MGIYTRSSWRKTLERSKDAKVIFHYSTMKMNDSEGTVISLAHEDYMQLALSFAEKSPPKPTNFRVGALLVDEEENKILSTGYTLELPGNKHAEQCCLEKFATALGINEESVGDFLPKKTVLYTTVEPCGKRLSGNLPCIDRILRTRANTSGGIVTVYYGVKEPETFVGKNTGRSRLEAASITCVHITGMEEQILKVATAGHASSDD